MDEETMRSAVAALKRALGKGILLCAFVDDDNNVHIGHNICCLEHASELLTNIAEQLSGAASADGTLSTPLTLN